ncbi:unnamed protein product [Cuscuta campestris]|uniref:Uncharacterized protein n=1 Tax=Cuscuta campestris TaxID=132261 RepID=A0A484KQS4_9ASTE|nr:unnamed protein product [Cuscuta campestris]
MVEVTPIQLGLVIMLCFAFLVVLARYLMLVLTLLIGVFGRAWVILANKWILWLCFFSRVGMLFLLDPAYLRLASELKPRAIVDEGLRDNLVNLVYFDKV